MLNHRFPLAIQGFFIPKEVISMNEKSLSIAIKALGLALMEFKRISYHKKADASVIEAIESAIAYLERQRTK